MQVFRVDTEEEGAKYFYTIGDLRAYLRSHPTIETVHQECWCQDDFIEQTELKRSDIFGKSVSALMREQIIQRFGSHRERK